MTEIETLQRAQMYIRKLAEGIDPITGEAVPENDVVNNVRIARCFYYISDVLDKVIANGGVEPKKKVKKCPFSITAGQLEKYEYSESPIPISEIAKRINSLIDESVMKGVKTRALTEMLTEAGLLEKITLNNSSVKRPTAQGRAAGISTEERTSQYGKYTAVLYDPDAQRLIVDNVASLSAQ